MLFSSMSKTSKKRRMSRRVVQAPSLPTLTKWLPQFIKPLLESSGVPFLLLRSMLACCCTCSCSCLRCSCDRPACTQHLLCMRSSCLSSFITLRSRLAYMLLPHVRQAPMSFLDKGCKAQRSSLR